MAFSHTQASLTKIAKAIRGAKGSKQPITLQHEDGRVVRDIINVAEFSRNNIFDDDDKPRDPTGGTLCHAINTGRSYAGWSLLAEEEAKPRRRRGTTPLTRAVGTRSTRRAAS